MILWPLFILLQSFAFTFVSRARNSGSIMYHAVAAIGSNSFWFIQNVFLIRYIVDQREHTFWTGVLYVSMMLFGSLTSHFLALKLERKKGIQ